MEEIVARSCARVLCRFFVDWQVGRREGCVCDNSYLQWRRRRSVVVAARRRRRRDAVRHDAVAAY